MIPAHTMMNKEVIWEADNDERIRVIFFIFVTGLGCGTCPEGPKMRHTFYYPMVKSSFSAFVSAKLHIQRLSGKPRTMVASMCRCVLSVIGFGDGTSPEWRPAGPVELFTCGA